MEPTKYAPEDENHSFNIFASVWVIPLIALLISGWLVYQHYAKMGSEIAIDFPSSNGLVSGESVVKFRNVVVGKIVRITLQPDGEGVTVFARMSKESDPYLNDKAHFWIAKPELNYQGIRGLDTIMNGSYINMYSVRGGEERSHFAGNLKPYRGGDEGFYVHLFSDKLDTIHVGAPVYYRNLQAGTIEDIRFDSRDKQIKVLLFLKKPYRRLINSTTRFWSQSLITAQFKNDEFVFRMAPIATLVWGSIAFDSRFDKKYPSHPLNKPFRLYYNKSDIAKENVTVSNEKWQKVEFVFRGQVSGLKKGASIAFQGFCVGEVEAVDMSYSHALMDVESRVRGRINVAFFNEPDRNGTENVIDAVAHGLHGELKSANPLFTRLYIDLSFNKDANTSRTIIAKGDRWIFPSKLQVDGAIFSRFDHLLASVSDLSDEAKEPLKKVLSGLTRTIKNINQLTGKSSFVNLSDDLNATMSSLRNAMGDDSDLNKAIEELRKTLKTTKSVLRGYSSGSLFGKKLEAMLREVERTSEETKRFIEKLNKKPNALIFGE